MFGKWFKLLWLAVAYIIYLVLGAELPYLRHPKVSEEYKESFNTDDFYGTGESADRAAVVEDNEEALMQRIRLISRAKERIIFSTFDFAADTSGKQVIAALLSAADRGVQVRVLVDGAYFLVRSFGNADFRALAAHENVTVKIYNRLNFLIPWKLMSRMHDKYLIADDTGYMLGGRNTNDLFLGKNDGKKNIDRELLVIKSGGGESSISVIEDYFEKIWAQKDCKVRKVSDRAAGSGKTAAAGARLRDIYREMKEEHPDWFEVPDYKTETVPVKKISLISNPTKTEDKEPKAFYSLCRLMAQANKKVVIHTPYIVYNKYMYDSMKKVCSSAPEVHMMTNSAKNTANAFGAVELVQNKRKILGTGVNLTEYSGGLNYHGKSILIDEDISIVGSFNMDMRSAYQDTELMLVVHSEELNAQLSKCLSRFQKDEETSYVHKNRRKELMEGQTAVSKAIRGFLWVIDPGIRYLV